MGKCSLCGSPGTSAASCPLNPYSLSPDPKKHPLATGAAPTLKAKAQVPKAKANAKAGSMTFTSPSNYAGNGEDDLYGELNGDTLTVRSHHDENLGFMNFQKQIKGKGSILLNDPKYHPTQNIVAVSPQGGTSYTIVSGSDIWNVSGIPLSDWRAEVGNVGMVYVYAKHKGTEYAVIPTDYLPDGEDEDDVEFEWSSKIDFMDKAGQAHEFPGVKLEWIRHTV